jgi:hypothetical protein
LDQLKNGDILQFSDYRECGTYYCIWLTKGLVDNELVNEEENGKDGEEDAKDGLDAKSARLSFILGVFPWPAFGLPCKRW